MRLPLKKKLGRPKKEKLMRKVKYSTQNDAARTDDERCMVKIKYDGSRCSRKAIIGGKCMMHFKQKVVWKDDTTFRKIWSNRFRF